MPLDEEDRASLVDMLGFAREVAAFTAGRTRADLDRDVVLLRAIERTLELIGECARRVSSATQERHKAIPWRNIIGMRNIIIHEYGRVDIDELWRTVQRDMPPLVSALEAIVNTLPPPST
jgi:uncharacterized protein with HEPN domain